MHVLAHRIAVGIGLVLAGCGGPGTPDARVPIDDAGAVDAAVIDAAVIDAAVIDGAAIDAPSGDDGGPITCDVASRPDLGTSIQLARGLTIARDGTIYVSQPGGVGRRLPDGTLELDWVTIPGVDLTLSVALDAANEHVFTGAPDGDGGGAPSVFRIAVATGDVTPLASGGFPYGMTIGPDGMLYWSDTASGHVSRIDPDGGTPEAVTTTPIASARGLAFEPGGTLLVASASPGQLWRLTLTDGAETARATVGGAVPTLSTPTGIALDARGRIYVTEEFGGRPIQRMDPDGSGQTSIGPSLSSPYFLDFGHGALCPLDLYVVTSVVMRIETDAAGGEVPWH